MMIDANAGRESSFYIRRKEKEMKYAPLIKNIKTTWNADATCCRIIIFNFIDLSKSS